MGASNASAYRTPRISPWIMYPLSGIMLFYAVLPLLALAAPKDKFAAAIEEMKHAPFLASIREPDGEIRLLYRLRDAPVLYSTHIAAAIAWSIGIPLQHAASIRRRYPAFHRAVGYIVFTSSLILGVGGTLFAPLKLAYTHPDLWHIHRPFSEQLPWLGWPTFEASIYIFGPVQLITAFLALKAARERNIPKHQRLATMHTLAGGTVPLERAVLTLFGMGGAFLRSLSDTTQRQLGIPTDEKQFWRAEMASFSASVWVAGLVTFPYMFSMMRPSSKTKAS